MKPGVSVAQADAELRIIAGRLAGQYTETNKGWGIYLLTPKELVAQQFNIAGVLYFLPVGFVLLIACANVAHLQLTRALEREKEMALRTALGAGRFRIVRQLLSESILIGVLGGLAGMTVAYGAIRGLQAYLPPQFTQSIGGLRLDGEALWFMLAVALASGVIFGFAPAWKASRVDLNHTLKEGSTRSSIGRGGKRFRQVMLISEIALTTMLLGGAGLTLSMFGGGTHNQMGFNSKNLLTMAAGLQSTRYAKPDIDSAWTFAAQYVHQSPGQDSAFTRRRLDMYVAGAIARAGLADSARRVLVRARAKPGSNIDPKHDLSAIEAIMRVMLGDQDEAVRLLKDYLTVNPEHRKGFATRTMWWWRDLQSNPRFKSLIAVEQ